MKTLQPRAARTHSVRCLCLSVFACVCVCACACVAVWLCPTRLQQRAGAVGQTLGLLLAPQRLPAACTSLTGCARYGCPAVKRVALL